MNEFKIGDKVRFKKNMQINFGSNVDIDMEAGKYNFNTEFTVGPIFRHTVVLYIEDTDKSAGKFHPTDLELVKYNLKVTYEY